MYLPKQVYSGKWSFRPPLGPCSPPALSPQFRVPQFSTYITVGASGRCCTLGWGASARSSSHYLGLSVDPCSLFIQPVPVIDFVFIDCEEILSVVLVWKLVCILNGFTFSWALLICQSLSDDDGGCECCLFHACCALKSEHRIPQVRIRQNP